MLKLSSFDVDLPKACTHSRVVVHEIALGTIHCIGPVHAASYTHVIAPGLHSTMYMLT
jgi:hypothetical protein